MPTNIDHFMETVHALAVAPFIIFLVVLIGMACFAMSLDSRRNR